jgi:hypothetical protein
MRIFRTNEGLYVSTDHEADNLPEVAKYDKMDMTGFLALAEADKENFALYLKLQKLDDNICTNFLSIINSYKLEENRFFKIYDSNGNDLVLHNADGIIYIPQCKEISNIKIENTEKCYKDIPISFKFNNLTTNGFLLKDRIITRYSEAIDCKKVQNSQMLVGSDMIIRMNNQVEVKSLTSMNIRFEIISKHQVDLDKLNFMHSNEILEGTDIVSAVHDLTSIDETSGTRLISNEIPDESNNSFFDPMNIFHLKLGKIGFYISLICATIILIALIFTFWKLGMFTLLKKATILCFGFCKKARVNRKKTQKPKPKSEPKAEIELAVLQPKLKEVVVTSPTKKISQKTGSEINNS